MPDAFEAVASPRRREILRLVWDSERSAGEIAGAMPEVTFGAVSQHLKLLAEAGLVARRGEGRSRYYRANPAALAPLRDWLEAMWGDALARLKDQAEREAQDFPRIKLPGPSVSKRSTNLTPALLRQRLRRAPPLHVERGAGGEVRAARKPRRRKP